MNRAEGRPGRAQVRAASRKSAEIVAAWNAANADLSPSRGDVITLLEELADSFELGGNFGPTVPSLRILCSLLPGAPSPPEAGAMTKQPLVRAMLEAAKAIGSLVPGTVEGGNPEDGFSSESTGDESELEVRGVVEFGAAATLFKYRSKDLKGVPKSDVFNLILKDLEEELVFLANKKSVAPAVAVDRYSSLAKFLPVMLKKHSLTDLGEMADPAATYIVALERFLNRHGSWKRQGSDKDGSVSQRKRVRASVARASDEDTDDKEPPRKVSSVVPFARPFKPVGDIDANLVRKGKALSNLFEVWRNSDEKVLPYKALKFIGNEVAAPTSTFYHPTKGVYNVFVADSQISARDRALRNIFEDVATKLVPGRELRMREYRAAEELRDRGGKLAKEIRKSREKSESKLLARLALECELCMMGVQSRKDYKDALIGDGVTEAIQASFRQSDGSGSDEDNTVSRKLAVAAWKRACASRVTPPRSKRGNRASKQPKSEAKLMAEMIRSGFASVRQSLSNGKGGNGGWNDGGGKANDSRSKGNQSRRSNQGRKGELCWHCNKPGHTQWQKDQCSLAGQDPAPGSVHAKKNADRAAAASAAVDP